ncbi:MAG: metal-dependent phosphohydrolase [Cyanobacteria bacterium P01_D01_bin.71]
MCEFNRDLVWLCNRYQSLFGQSGPRYDQVFVELATPVLQTIAQSDAPYHNLEHTLRVMRVGQTIIEGKQHDDGSVSPKDWLNFLLGLSCHDVGYVKGIFERDNCHQNLYFDGKFSQVRLCPSATGAALSDCHVDRSKAYAEIYLNHTQIEVKAIQSMIEMTRFPIPHQGEYRPQLTYPGLCRAADLLGQLGDPDYLQKLPKLFREFAETGMNQALGYTAPEALKKQYPYFFWQVVYPYVKGSMRYLSATPAGRRAIAQLYTNLCIAELSQASDDAPLEEFERVEDESAFLPWQEAGFVFS